MTIVCKIISLQIGVICNDNIYLDIPGPQQFPDDICRLVRDRCECISAEFSTSQACAIVTTSIARRKLDTPLVNNNGAFKKSFPTSPAHLTFKTAAGRGNHQSTDLRSSRLQVAWSKHPAR